MTTGISLQQAIEEQRDLAALCRPSRAHRHEKYSPNDNYGAAYILKKYAGFPIDEPINAVIPHGIYFRDRVLPVSELSAPVGSVLTFPPYYTKLWRKSQKAKKVVPFSSPINYALNMFQNETPVDRRHGSIFFPKHSTAAVDIRYDMESVLGELTRVPEEYKPVTVCLHWHDIQKGHAERYATAGYDVVCAGHLTDCLFVFRWLHLVTRHKLAIGCGLQSALFYSVSAGVPFYLLDEDAEAVDSPGDNRFNKSCNPYSMEAARRMAKLRSLFSRPCAEITNGQRELVEHYTQKALTLPSSQLLQFLQSLQ